MKPLVILTVAIVWLASACDTAAQTSTSTSADGSVLLLHGPAGDGGGGCVRAGPMIAETSTGSPIAGGVGDLSNAGVVLKPNLTGQLVDPVELTVSSSPPVVDERSTCQLFAEALMDDGTSWPVPPEMVDWSADTGEFVSIGESGLVTARSVFQYSTCIIQGVHRGASDPDGYQLPIINTGNDDYEEYAGDGLDDDWQEAYFGEPPNPQAMPAVDADGDGRNNLLEFLSGFSPTDPMERFMMTMEAVDRSAGTADLRVNRVIPNRLYTLKSSPELSAPFTVIGNLPPFAVPYENLLIRDNQATEPRKFYIIEISKP
jgi:hypothetical protein